MTSPQSSISDILDRLTDAQRKALKFLASDRVVHQADAQEVAYRMGYHPARTGILAATSALRALERLGCVYRSPPRDQWACAKWGVLDLGRDVASALRASEGNRS
jgi:hypothetical protein